MRVSVCGRLKGGRRKGCGYGRLRRCAGAVRVQRHLTFAVLSIHSFFSNILYRETQRGMGRRRFQEKGERGYRSENLCTYLRSPSMRLYLASPRILQVTPTRRSQKTKHMTQVGRLQKQLNTECQLYRKLNIHVAECRQLNLN